MSGVIDAFGDAGDVAGPRSSRILSRTAHLFPAVAATAFTGVIVDDITGGLLPGWISVLSLAVYIAVFLIAMVHNVLARLCLRCMQDVPADAPAQAARKRWLLWADHHYLRIYLLVLALGFASRWIGAWIGLPEGPSPLYLPGDLILLAQVAGIWTHHRLRPWCPFCRRWDDGQGPRELTPTPDPAGVKTA